MDRKKIVEIIENNIAQFQFIIKVIIDCNPSDEQIEINIKKV